MFSKTITNSSRFLMMPRSTQTLYFHLGINADDDGFCEHFSIMRMIEAKPDDLKILQVRNFVEVFDDLVLIIRDWKEHNYIRPDRYHPSKYLSIYKDELKALNSGIPDVIPEAAKRSPEVRLGKVRLGKEETSSEGVVKSKKGTKIRGKIISDAQLEKIGQTILTWFNQTTGTHYKSIKGFKSNLAYWLNEYDENDIKKALTAIGNGEWWAKNPSPTLLFRRKTPQGEPADYIGSLISGGR